KRKRGEIGNHQRAGRRGYPLQSGGETQAQRIRTLKSAFPGAVAAIQDDVKRFYEAFPYPRYSLTMNPRWQEGYASSPAFARAVAGDPGIAQSPTLIVGCGEILPQVIAKWIPRTHRLWCLDLSRTSLLRARIRLAKSARGAAFLAQPLEEALSGDELPSFGHIDAYGVLHHTARPLENLAKCAAKLLPGGTMRLMVYNSAARGFLL